MDEDGFRLYLQVDRGQAENTVRTRINAVKKLSALCDLFNEQELKRELSKILLKKGPDGHNSIAGYNHYVKGIKSYFQFLKKEPFEFLKVKPEKPRERVTLSDSEIEELIAIEDTRYSIFWMILAYTGARTKEVRTLRASHVDLSSKVIYFNDTKNVSRYVPIAESILSPLTTYLRTLETEYLFASEKGYISDRAYLKDWDKRKKLLGIKKAATPYSMRHSFITNLLSNVKNGTGVFYVQGIVGHKKLETTAKYMHKNAHMLQKTINMLPLNEARQDERQKVEKFIELFDDYFRGDSRFDPIELMEAKKHLYKSIQR